ncbi:MAG: zinc metalloprotease HtpX, partial [Planctomycetota bacterium]
MSQSRDTFMINIYDQQKHNKQATWLLIFLFIIILVVLGFGFDLFFTGAPPAGTIIALVFAGISVLGSYYYGDKIVLAATGARPVNHSNLKEHQFHNIVEEVKIASGLPMPAVYIIPDPDPKAFATGRDPS